MPHLKSIVKSPQTNGICERFHKTIQDEFYAVAFRKKIYHIKSRHVSIIVATVRNIKTRLKNAQEKNKKIPGSR